MLRRLLRFFIPVLLVLVSGTPAAQAQAPTTETEKSERSAPGLPWAVLLICTLLVLTIVCMPSRKA